MEKFSERLNYLLDGLQITQADIMRLTGQPRQAISNMFNNLRPMPDKDVLKICKQWPEINFEWLKFGKGEAPTLRKKSPDSSEVTPLVRNEADTEKIKANKAQVGRIRLAMDKLSIDNANQLAMLLNISRSFSNEVLKGFKNFSNEKIELLARLAGVNVSWLLTGEGDMHKEKTTIYQARQRIPYYDIDVTASNIERNEDWIPSIPTSYLEIPMIGNCDMALPVYGTSMAPAYNPGDVVAYKQLYDWKNFIEYGQAYLVHTKERRLLKYIRASEISREYLKLCSHNEAMGFDPFDVHKNEILGVYIVVGKIEKKII